MSLMQRPLWPALGVIENRLFAPSDPLLQRWLDRDPSLAPDLSQALAADPEALARRELLQECRARPVALDPAEVPPLPALLRDGIRRRLQSARAPFSPIPIAGQVVAVTRIAGPAGPLDWDLPRPLAALLNAPAEVPQVWQGWLVAPETDYAGPWDLLLEDGDGPPDPLAGMVQLWNPVHLYLATAGPVLAQLPPPRLMALRALAAEFLTGPDPDAAQARPGRPVSRRLGGLEVMTGSPLAGLDDPRHRYQTLYHAAAEALREPARLAMAAAARADWRRRLADAIGAAARALGLAFGPAPEVAHAMAAVEALVPGEAHFFLEGGLHLAIEAVEDAWRIGLHAGDSSPWTLSLYCGDELLQRAQVAHAHAQDELFLDPGQPCRLVVEGGPVGCPVHLEIPLPMVD